MCWLPIDQPLLLPGDSTCAPTPSPSCTVAQLLASRLRRIGDQLEKKSWTARGESACGYGADGSAARAPYKSLLCSAIHLTVLVLLLTRQHL